MSFDADFLESLARALNKAGLDAVVVGNAGAILRGAPVLTQDVDLFVLDTFSNRRKIEDVARRLKGAQPAPVDDASSALRIRAEVPIDILFFIGDDLRFGKVRARSRNVRVGRQTLRVASLRDIIRSKEAAGRLKDLAVLPILRDTLRVEEATRPVRRRVHRYQDPDEEEESEE